MWLNRPHSLAHFGLVISKTARYIEKNILGIKQGCTNPGRQVARVTVL